MSHAFESRFIRSLNPKSRWKVRMCYIFYIIKITASDMIIGRWFWNGDSKFTNNSNSFKKIHVEFRSSPELVECYTYLCTFFYQICFQWLYWQSLIVTCDLSQKGRWLSTMCAIVLYLCAAKSSAFRNLYIALRLREHYV